jgi:hypothetical protein
MRNLSITETQAVTGADIREVLPYAFGTICMVAGVTIAMYAEEICPPRDPSWLHQATRLYVHFGALEMFNLGLKNLTGYFFIPAVV